MQAPAAAGADAAARGHAPGWLLGPDYPLEVSAAFHVALFHWLDSLAGLRGAGLTAGKTVDAHRDEYRALFGAPTAEDRAALDAWGRARVRSVRQPTREQAEAMAVAFFEATNLDGALAATARALEPAALAEMRPALERFGPRYPRIWDDGRVPRAFVEAAARDSKREALAAFLARMARFHGVAPDSRPSPRIHLVPVIDGHGTHAQAVGRHLLIEIRPGEGLGEEVAPIVHENAHLQFLRMDPARREALESAAKQAGPEGEAAWRLLREALPTALGQGVAARRFAPGNWSRRRPWYHLEDVDAYAKRLLPLVQQTLDAGGTFDEAFLREALARAAATPR